MAEFDLNFGTEETAEGLQQAAAGRSSYGTAAQSQAAFTDRTGQAQAESVSVSQTQAASQTQYQTTSPTSAEAVSPAQARESAAAQAQHEPEEAVLSSDELRQVDEFSKKIDITNSKAIMTYGVGTQKKMADFSEKTLDSVRTKDMGEVGDMITGLVTELKNFDVDEQEKGIRGFFKKKSNQVQEMKTKYAKVETNVNEISNKLEQHQVTLLKDVEVLDRMYELNLNYYKELSMYILAGKKKLREVRETQLPELQRKAQQSGLPEDAQRANDLAEQCDRFEKKLHDLQLTRTIAMQTGPQIRMIQSSDQVMAEKIQSTIVNTIPLWKNQMVIAIGIEHSTQAAKAEREVNDMTNALLRKNAEKLKQATVESARESERGIVDIETLKNTNEMLISTMDEVMQIQSEGKQKRAAAEKDLAAIETQLREKLLQASRQ